MDLLYFLFGFLAVLFGIPTILGAVGGGSILGVLLGVGLTIGGCLILQPE